nr:hypothetical protein [bacterium]
TRRVIQWARLLPHFDFDVLRAFELSCVRKLENPTDAKVAREVCKRIFAYDDSEVASGTLEGGS